MLSSLHIENLAVIKSLDVDFRSGFTVLTGQTGAGKSVIIDSIGLLLGKKADKELIRTGERGAMVSGLFTGFDGQAERGLAAFGVYPDEEGALFVQRTVTSDGKSTIRINGRAVGLSVLKSISDSLINIHGQSDTHSLTDPKLHISILDSFAELEELLSEYRSVYFEYDNIRKEIKSITEKEQERVRLTEILEYQVNDIDKLSLKEGEEEELIERKLKIKHSERISKQAGFVFKALKGSEKGSVYSLLDRSVSALQSLSDVIPEFSGYSEKLRDMLYQIDEIAEDVYASLEEPDSDPTEKLNQIESRLDKISRIKRKYGYTVEEVMAFRDRAAKELEELKNADDILEDLRIKMDALYERALCLADKLHEQREKHAAILEETVKKTLEFLDMPKVVFFASIKQNASAGKKILDRDGYDSIEFFISANRGMDAQSLAKIASGGELARIMLAIKCALADKSGTSTLIFDEIDAGVSGKTARKIGIKLLELSRITQIFSVTHSAQIASLADTHYLITKSDVGGSVSTAIEDLNEEGRIDELSRILGGISVTHSQREAALDMLKEKEVYC